MATLTTIIIYTINFSYQYNLAGAYHLNTFLTSSIIIDPSIKKAKALKKWNSIPEKENNSLPEKKIEELDFTLEEINDQACTTTKMKQKRKIVKKKSEKEGKCRI